MRPAFAVLLVIIFAVLFVAALLVSRVVNTAGDPDEIAGVIDDAELYDFIYDRVIDAAIADLVAQGFTVSTGPDGEEAFEFQDPAQARAAIKAFVETILPREYVKQKLEETLDGVVPYVSGRTDSFEVDLETSERIEAIPEAIRVAAERIGLGQLVVAELVVPTVRDLSESITDEALGIEFTPDEAEEAAVRILPPEWIEAQVFSFVDQTAPYFAGTEDELNLTITFKDRVPVAGQILKDKLNDEDTLVRLVFEQTVDPLVGQLVADSTVIVFGIEITESDIQEAVEIVAPNDWVRAQGDGIIDALVAWLVGATDNLEYTLELADRKADAAVQLDILARRKLDEQVAAAPVCTTQFQTGQAVSDALAGRFPSCLPANSSQVVDIMEPLISNEIQNFVVNLIPDQITYSDADLRAQLGGESLETLDTLRGHIANGLTFTDEDLVNQFASDADPEAADRIRERLDLVRTGFAFDQTDITDRMDAEQLAQFDRARGWIDLGWTLRWLIFLPALLLLLLVAFIGGRNWPGRARWAGAPLAIVAVIFFAAIQIGWASTASFREFEVGADAFSAENGSEFPMLSSVVTGGELQNMAERVGGAWISGLAMSAVPWALGGAALFALGMLYPKYRHRLPAALGGPRGGSGRGPKVITRTPGAWVSENAGKKPAEEDPESSSPEEAA